MVGAKPSHRRRPHWCTSGSYSLPVFLIEYDVDERKGIVSVRREVVDLCPTARAPLDVSGVREISLVVTSRKPIGSV